MSLLCWMIDLARDQSPREDVLARWFDDAAASGYNAIGLYLEHRYAYPSAPWAAGPGALTPDVARRLVQRGAAAGLRVIPFLNTLGHMEGFIRAEGGQPLAEGPHEWSLSMCPSRPICAEFARGLIADMLPVFDDEWVHVGGDETWQLGQCPTCAARVGEIGVAGLYGEYMGGLCRWVLEQGRRPCVWGDMLLKHPDALDHLPKQTIVFDWQYFKRPADTSGLLRRKGFDVVCCTSIQSYNSVYCFLDATKQNIDEHAADARELGALGVCLTTWEMHFFSHYAAILPLVHAAGRRLSRSEEWTDAIRAAGGDEYVAAAEILGNRIPSAAAFLRAGTWRNLRARLVHSGNPFALWRDWRDEACGPAGDQVLRLCREATAPLTADHPLQYPAALYRTAVDWVRCIDRAYQNYRRREFEPCGSELDAGERILAGLRPHLERAAEAGGALADLARLDGLCEKARIARQRLAALDASSGYVPAFESLVHDNYIPHFQAGWRTGERPAATASATAS